MFARSSNFVRGFFLGHAGAALVVVLACGEPGLMT